MNEQLIEKFLNYLKYERQLSENTYSSYRIDLYQFDRYTNIKISKLSKQQLMEYIEYLRANYKESSYLRKVAALKSFNKYLESNNLEANQAITLLSAKKRERRIPKYLSQTQIDLFLNSIEGSGPYVARDKAMFETLYATGMRVSEIINLKMSNLNLENGTIRVYGKGNKERLVILNQTATDSLITYINHYRINLLTTMSDYLFLNSKGTSLTRQGFNFILKKYATNAGISDISPHIFRHSIATHMLNNGGDLRMIQLILGHANITTTEVYTHVSKQEILKKYEELHPLAKERNE